jgi:hypothetical protein
MCFEEHVYEQGLWILLVVGRNVSNSAGLVSENTTSELEGQNSGVLSLQYH